MLQYMICLRRVEPKKLRKECFKQVFKMERAENAIVGGSASLMRACKPAIKVNLPYLRCKSPIRVARVIRHINLP